MLNNLGWLAHNQGDTARAEDYFVEGLVIARDDGYETDIAWCLAGLGFVAVARGRAERAARLLGAAKEPFDAAGALMLAEDKAEFERNVVATRAQLGGEAFAAAWETGRAMTLEEAVAEALEDTSPRSFRPFPIQTPLAP